MSTFTTQTYLPIIPTNIQGILSADIGGTNANFGIFHLQDGKLAFLFSLHIKSKEITNFTDAMQEIVSYCKAEYGITFSSSCIAAAGVPSDDRQICKPTNLPFTIDIKAIKERTKIPCMFLANDFEVIGHGLDLIAPKDIVQVKAGSPRTHTTKAIIGAGTGLGKCILNWQEDKQRYIPLPSEGGHADFPCLSQQELDLTKYIQNYEGWKCNISWEDLLSGNGIQRMYHFFKHIKPHNQERKVIGKHGPLPDEIFKSRNLDPHCFDTFALYAKIYARCAKDFALDTLALSGMYIAGGIATKNLPLFQQPEFLAEFVNCGKQQALLEQIPIYVITDYNVSLWGAAQYMLLEKWC